MSIIYSFFDNQTIGVDDLNKITSRLISQGVARQPSSVSQLNSFLTDVAVKGVVPETVTSLKVSLENEQVKINSGTAFFDNGTVIELTEPEYLDFTAGTKSYVYLISDSTENKAYPLVADSQPQNQNILLLAEISADSVVTDKRMYAKGKLAYYGSADVNNNVYIEEQNLNTSQNIDAEGYIVYRIDINPGMYRFLHIIDMNNIGFTRCDLTNNTLFSFGYGLGSLYDYSTGVFHPVCDGEGRWDCLMTKDNSGISFRFKPEVSCPVIPLSVRFELIA